MLTEISNVPRDYAWGSRTLIATLQGRRPSGRPEAELWLGDHPGSPATVADGSGRTIDDLLAETPGAPAHLPFLLKLLAAASPLSIQVHPTTEQAREGFAREEAAGVPRDAPERNYRDDSAKPEVLVAVSETFEALSGLRDLGTTRHLVASLGTSHGVSSLAARLAGDDAATALRETIAWLLSGEASEPVADVIAAAVTASADPRAEFAGDLAVTRRLAAAYPGDPGVAVALLMNHVVLERGEALFNRAGSLHAYLDGLGVEVMSASDNVLRGGLTPKHVDVPELLRVLDATPAAPAVLRPVPIADRVDVFDPGVADFALLRVRSRPQDVTSAAVSGPAIALVIEGSVTVSTRDAAIDLSPGRAALAVGTDALGVTGDGLVYIAEPGSPAARREG